VLASPYLYEALGPGRPLPLPGAGSMGTDGASLLVPLQVTLIRFGAGTAAKLPFVAEQGSYFGLPLLLGFLAALWQLRRARGIAAIAVVAAAALLLSLGATLTVAGPHLIALPWRLVERVPVAKVMIPDRLILYAWFCLALVLALWLASPGRHSRWRWAVVLVGALLILPDGGSPLLSGRADNPRLFTSDAYRHVLPARSTVLTLPFGFGGYGMLWQAESSFSFRMPEGYVGYSPPRQFGEDPSVAKLIASQVAGSAAVPYQFLRAFLYRYHVNVVLVDAAQASGWPGTLAALGLRGRLVDGVIIYRLNPQRFSATFGAIRLNTLKPRTKAASTIPIGISSSR
jgi:hypothetical protein